MSETAPPASRRKLLLVVAIAVVVVVAAFALWRLMDGDDAKPAAADDPSETTATPSTGTSGTPTPTPTPTPTSTASCEGPDTQFNVEGVRQESLLPDCGIVPVTREQQKKKGLGLACGGSFPVILYKTTTTGSSTSICGKDSSGESFRFVTKPRGGAVLDLEGQYDPERDAFVARNDGVTYAVTAYNGEMLVTKDGTTTTQASDGDWISLDNESDFD